MHETGIVRDLVRRIESAAREAGAERIARVSVRLGALSQFTEAHFRIHFDEDVAGTLAEGAVLVIETAEDPLDPHAQDVLIQSVDLVMPDEIPPGG
jgi:hydrogenase nickel incorporation protein HypA/HybF